MIKKIFDITIPLYSEDNPGYEKQRMKVMTVNHMYATNFKWFRWKRFLTPEAQKYKKHLEECIQKRIKEFNQNFDIKDKSFFYTIDFYICLPLNKNGDFNKTYFVDLDWLIKPIQDALSTKKDRIWIWNDDKQIPAFLPTRTYVKTPEEAKIEISIYEESEELLELIKEFKNKLKK